MKVDVNDNVRFPTRCPGCGKHLDDEGVYFHTRTVYGVIKKDGEYEERSEWDAESVENEGRPIMPTMRAARSTVASSSAGAEASGLILPAARRDLR